MRLVLINNICTHYTFRTFELLAQRLDARFLFFSDGSESFWEKANDLPEMPFNHCKLRGFKITSRFRIVPGLFFELLTAKMDFVVMALGGRFALPVAYLTTRLRRKPFILWSGLWYHPDSFFHRISWPLTQWIYRDSDAILTYGNHVKRYLVEQGIDAAKIFPFWHCVDTDKMGRQVDRVRVEEYRKRWSPQGDPIVLYVGRLEDVKSLDTLVAAHHILVQNRPNCLVLVGRGSQRDALQSQGERLGTRVVFEDFVPNSLLPEVFAAADVFCLPSKTLPLVKEAWGLVLNEAMLQRCIPVASDAVGAAVGGLFFSELEELVFPEGNVERLVVALSKALDLSADQEMREKVRSRSLEFSPENQVQGLFRAIRFIEERRGRKRKASSSR